MRKKQDEIAQLVEGSHYKIRSMSSKDEVMVTSGYFKGYVQFGRGKALKIEMDEEVDGSIKTRVIPCHMVTCVDIIEEAEAKDDEKKERSSYHG